MGFILSFLRYKFQIIILYVFFFFFPVDKPFYSFVRVRLFQIQNNVFELYRYKNTSVECFVIRIELFSEYCTVFGY